MKVERLEWCPWGCGQLLAAHTSERPCPPSDGAGNWINRGDRALGSIPQLQNDVLALTEFRKSLSCANCRHAITVRVNVIEKELQRRGLR